MHVMRLRILLHPLSVHSYQIKFVPFLVSPLEMCGFDL